MATMCVGMGMGGTVLWSGSKKCQCSYRTDPRSVIRPADFVSQGTAGDDGYRDLSGVLAQDAFPGEVVTRAIVRDVDLGAGVGRSR